MPIGTAITVTTDAGSQRQLQRGAAGGRSREAHLGDGNELRRRHFGMLGLMPGRPATDAHESFSQSPVSAALPKTNLVITINNPIPPRSPACSSTDN